MKLSNKPHARKYQQLLFVLIVTFFVSPFLKAGIGQVFSALLLLFTIIVTIRSFALPKLLFSVYSAIALLAFWLELAANLGWIPFLNQTFALLAQAIYALYLGGAAYWVGRDIFRSPEVTADTVRGGISVYLLLGFVWALFYGMVATLDAGAFSEPLLLQESYLKALHFSFTTLTTLGYGDIVPLSDIALVLTNLEAIIGQMYSTVFIAILVGGYLAQRSRG